MKPSAAQSLVTYRPFKGAPPKQSAHLDNVGIYTTNPCAEILLGIEADREQAYVKAYMNYYFGGVPYEEVLEMVKDKYPENFI